ncbi:MAG: right-handed parallel beta-helix repeat-containing protein, partial [bacterium]|nr:right-handed parallel beta-helix repeat-containing protein [bacterium]
NNTSASIDLAGWKLQSSDADGPDIELVGNIGANSFYLIERTDDNPTTETANLTGSIGNGLSNPTCEVLYLYNSTDDAIDQTFCNSDNTWPAGEASPNYISLERINPQTSGADATNWATNNLISFNGKDAANNWINGTPKSTNSVSLAETEITNLRFDEFSTLTLTLLGQPYYKSSQLTIPSGKTLTIEPGVTVKLKGGAAKLEVSGALNAVGTSSENIIFTTYQPPGSSNIWCGLHFTSTSQNSDLQYVTVEKAGSTTSGCGSGNPQYSVFVESSSITFKNSTITGGNGYRKLYLKNSNSTIDASTISGASNDTSSAAIYIDGGSPTITNSTFSDNTIGIWNISSSGTPTISSNTFTNSTYPIKLTGGSATVSGNNASGNTYDGILVETSASADLTWAANNIPYIIDAFTVNSGKTLTLQAGVTVKFANITSGGRELTINGNLITQGTAGQLVTFSPWTSGGNWKRIYLNTGSTADLQYTTLERGGNTYSQGALHIKTSTVQISNVEIKNSLESAVYGFNATISGSNLTLTDNKYGLHIQTGDCPSVTNVVNEDPSYPGSVSCTF